MKWGVTKKESKAQNARASSDFYAKKADSLFASAHAGGDKVLMKTLYQGDHYQTITTGKGFIKELQQGRAFDIRVSEVYATQPKAGGQFVLNDKPIGTYKQQDFRKSGPS